MAAYASHGTPSRGKKRSSRKTRTGGKKTNIRRMRAASHKAAGRLAALQVGP